MYGTLTVLSLGAWFGNGGGRLFGEKQFFCFQLSSAFYAVCRSENIFDVHTMRDYDRLAILQ
jgi:hypothetical protein